MIVIKTDNQTFMSYSIVTCQKLALFEDILTEIFFRLVLVPEIKMLFPPLVNNIIESRDNRFVHGYLTLRL